MQTFNKEGCQNLNSSKGKVLFQKKNISFRLVHKNTDSLIDDGKFVFKIKKLTKNKNTLLLFWNPIYVSQKFIRSRINFLTEMFPQVEFIQIRINGKQHEPIPQLNPKNQFFITPKSNANDFLTSKMPRAIILNKKGIITNGFASISSKKTHKDLKKLK